MSTLAVLPALRASRRLRRLAMPNLVGLAALAILPGARSFSADAPADAPAENVYEHRLTELSDPPPLLADHPEYVAPVEEVRRYEAPRLIDDPQADLAVRAWRYSYHARGIIELPNHLAGRKTAVVVVHPWGIDDGQGWCSPEPAGTAFACTPEKNRLTLQHGARVVEPLLASLRPLVGVVAYSLPGREDPIRRQLYRSIRGPTTAEAREAGQRQLEAKLAAFDYRGEAIPTRIPLTTGRPAVDYFRALPGLEATARFNHAGFWDLPIPVMRPIRVALGDVVFYDGEGYEPIRDFLRGQGIEHILLCGYHADMCVCSTAAGYDHFREDFNTFLVGDAVLATLPANRTPRHATNQAVSFASLKVLITQASWIKPLP